MNDLNNFIIENKGFCWFVVILVAAIIMQAIASVKNVCVAFLERKRPIIHNYYNCRVTPYHDDHDEDDD
jgi:hypothetical protein